MPRPRMYEPGSPIESMTDLLMELSETGYVCLFKHNKPSHAAFVRQHRLATLERWVKARAIRRAVLSDEWVAWAANYRRPVCIECCQNPTEPKSKICVGCHAYRDHTGAI